MENEQLNEKEFHFFQLQNGSKITCHGKPKKNDIAYLKKEYNIDVIITILSDKEGAEDIHRYTEEEGNIKWIHLPINPYSYNSKSFRKELLFEEKVKIFG